jgi:beta-N-acetylhexosaminidase
VHITTASNSNIGKIFMIGLPGPEADALTVEFLQEIRPGGVVLFARNIKSREQTRRLIDDVERILGYRPLFAVDQEGGLVDRLRRVLSPSPAAARMRLAEDARRLGQLAGESLAILGFDLDFAPVVDVLNEYRSKSSNGLYSRGFGTSKEQVVDLAGAFLEGLAEFGILGCLKHFPGLAAAEVDSHEELPQVDIDRLELGEVDLFPYKRLLPRGRCAVMVAHAVYPKANLQEPDSNGKLLPSSLDAGIVDGLLRSDLGFDGLVITDDLEMGAIVNTFGIGDACVKAIQAGNDMLAICAKPEGIRTGFAAVNSAVQNGTISGERIAISALRIDSFKDNVSQPPNFDDVRLQEIANEIEEFSRSIG